jgi:ERO1-like protein alpha
MNVTTQHCSLPFDEQQLFVDPASWRLKDEIKNKFYNISRIIDCVGCEKCRLHGKLQITGLGAALKILFESEPKLSRNELIVSAR